MSLAPGRDAVELREAPATLGAAECRNCGAVVDGAWCGACGQRARVERITFPGLLRGLAEQVVSVDSKLLRTFVALVRRPGEFVREWLLGRRVGFAKPLSYYLLVVALNVGASAVLRHAGEPPAEADRSFWDANFVALQISLAFGLLMLPLAGARRVLHEHSGWSVAEHFVFLLWMLAQSILVVLAVQIALVPLGVDPSAVEGPVWLASFVGLVVHGSRAFLREPLWRVALKLVAELALLMIAIAIAALLLRPFLA